MSTDVLEPETPETPETPLDLAEEQHLGGSPAAAAANAAVRALSRAARSFLIYEPHNEAIKVFLGSYQRSMADAFAYGPLELEVRPFELVREGEVVYMERDRGRSLAFRLFRDGVRKLTLDPEVPWEELLKLLEILSIRYTGVRQQEDDIVTLLWKAGFSKIAIGAVEGFVPDEEESDPEAAPTETRQNVITVEIPADWDRPFPTPLAPRPVRYVPIPPAYLQKIKQEGEGSLPALCLRLVQRMLAVVNDPTDPTTLEDVMPLIEEVRDFFLADGQLSWLGQLLDLLKVLPADEFKRLSNSFGSDSAIKRIVHGIGRGVEEAPPELIALLERLPGDHLSAMVALLAAERGETSRRKVLRKLVARFASGQPEVLVEGVRKAESNLAKELLKVCMEVVPESAVEAALSRLQDSDPEMRVQVLQVLAQAPARAEVSEALRQLFLATDGDLRLQVVDVAVQRHEKLLFEPLWQRIERAGLSGIPEREAEVIGVALARLDAERARGIFEKCLKPQGLLGRIIDLPGQRSQWWAAVSGLGVMSGEVEPLIRGMLDRVDADLRKHCMMVLVRRRHQKGA